MRNSLIMVMSAVLMLAFVGTTYGQQASQDVTIQVDAINVLAVSSGTVSLVIDSAVPGLPPTDASDNSTTYDVTTNQATRKIAGSLDVLYGTDIDLAVSLGAPTGATSAGSVTLTTTDQDLVSGVSNLAETGKSISYVASASVDSPIGSEENTVTFTILAGS